jgi:hypothetical protein
MRLIGVDKKIRNYQFAAAIEHIDWKCKNLG